MFAALLSLLLASYNHFRYEGPSPFLWTAAITPRLSASSSVGDRVLTSLEAGLLHLEAASITVKM